MNEEELMAIVLREGADHAAPVTRDKITYDPIFRDICAKNTCGSYGKCYMCPPDVGDIHELIKKAQAYDRGVLYQTIASLEDSFDIEGMMAAGDRHNECSRRVKDMLPQDARILHLSSGSCKACPQCAKREDLPCRYPEKAMASLESYGVDVYKTACAAGLKYINGTNTVTYFGMILFMEDHHA
jgi:predicted metal-binding protein